MTNDITYAELAKAASSEADQIRHYSRRASDMLDALAGCVMRLSEQVEQLQTESLFAQQHVATLEAENARLVNMIGIIYQITGQVPGGDEIESARRQAERVAALESENDRLRDVLTDCPSRSCTELMWYEWQHKRLAAIGEGRK